MCHTQHLFRQVLLVWWHRLCIMADTDVSKVAEYLESVAHKLRAKSTFSDPHATALVPAKTATKKRAPSPSKRSVTDSCCSKGPSLYHAACILPDFTGDIAPTIKKELKDEQKKRQKLECALNRAEQELQNSRCMVDDLLKSKKLALAMLFKTYQEYNKLKVRQRPDPPCRPSCQSPVVKGTVALPNKSVGAVPPNQSCAELKERLRIETNARMEVQDALAEAKKTIRKLEEQLSEERLRLQGRQPVSSDEQVFHECREQPSQEDVCQQEPPSNYRERCEQLEEQAAKDRETLNQTLCHCRELEAQLTNNNDQLMMAEVSCSELKQKLVLQTANTEELLRVKCQCEELRSQLDCYKKAVPELDCFRQRLQTKVRQLRNVHRGFTELQEMFTTAQRESKLNLEEKDKIIAVLRDNQDLLRKENEDLRCIVDDLNRLATKYLERIQELSEKKSKQEKLEPVESNLSEKEVQVCRSSDDTRQRCPACLELEREIESQQLEIERLHQQIGRLTVRAAAFCCQHSTIREALEHEIDQLRSMLSIEREQAMEMCKLFLEQEETIAELRNQQYLSGSDYSPFTTSQYMPCDRNELKQIWPRRSPRT